MFPMLPSDVSSDEMSNTDQALLPHEVSDIELPPDPADDEELDCDEFPELPDAIDHDESPDVLHTIDFDELPEVSDDGLDDINEFRDQAPATTLSSSSLGDDMHLVGEYYSPPRVVPVAAASGYRAMHSHDLLTGHDFSKAETRRTSLTVLLQLLFLILTPPCTAFSPLQALWNYPRLSPEQVRKIIDEGMVYWNHALDCCWAQYEQHRFFVLEHPMGASSWQMPRTRELMAADGVWSCVFDMCCFGLQTPITGQPMRKRTRILTNSAAIRAALQNRRCKPGTHVHRIIEGSEGGIKLARHAQCWPPALCEALVSAMKPV